MAQLVSMEDQYEAIATHLLELQDEIRLLQGSDNTIDRGLVGLADDVDVAGAELVLRGRDGNMLGAWRVADGENIRTSLDAVELVPVNEQTTPEESDAG